MPSSPHTPLARFIAGTYSLTASSLAGAAASTAITAAGTAAAPLALPIFGALVAFAGGVAVYKGFKQDEADTHTTEVHTYLEQMIKQHGDLTKALAALPADIPLSHAESCERIRQLSTIFASGPANIESRLKANPAFSRFATDSMTNIETQLSAQQHDLDRQTQMLLNARVLSEDQLTAIDSVAQSLGLLHEKADKTLDTVQDIAHRQGDQLTTADLDRLENSLLEKLKGRAEESQADPGTNKDLVSAVQRVAEDAEKGVYTAQRILETNDPNALPTYLKVRRERLLEAKSKLNAQVDAEAIQLDREYAATAFLTGQIDEAEQALSRILERLPNDLNAINLLGNVFRIKGDLQTAETLFKQLLTLNGHKETQAVANGNLSIIEQIRGNLDNAQEHLNQSLKLYDSLDNKEGVANVLGNLGLVERKRGNISDAEKYHLRSLKIHESLDNKEGVANQLGNLGLIEHTQGNLSAAQEYQNRSLEIHKRLGNKEGMANVLGNLGLIEQDFGDLDTAQEHHKLSLEINESLDCKEGIANQLGNLGTVAHLRGKLDSAQDYLKRSLDMNESLGRKQGVANQLGNLGLIELERGNIQTARMRWVRACNLFEQIGIPHEFQKTQDLINALPPATDIV